MEIIKDVCRHSLEEWEAEIDKRRDIELEEVRLSRGKVSGAIGNAFVGEQSFKVTWIFDGRCFCGSKRAPLWDIKL